MRKSLLLLLIILILVGCGDIFKETSKIDKNIRDSKEVYVIVLVVEDDAIVYRLTNETEQPIVYTEKVILEKKTNNKWYTIDLKEGKSFKDTSYTLEGQSEKELTFKYTGYYGELSAGEYRMAKEIGNNPDKIQYVIGSFKVD